MAKAPSQNSAPRTSTPERLSRRWTRWVVLERNTRMATRAVDARHSGREQSLRRTQSPHRAEAGAFEQNWDGAETGSNSEGNEGGTSAIAGLCPSIADELQHALQGQA